MTSSPGPPADAVAGEAAFGADRLFLADSRLAFVVLNHARHLVLRRVFGVSREQANLLTLVLALGGAEAAYATARRVVHRPRLPGPNVTFGSGLALREAAVAVGGPRARETPLFTTLVAVGLLGGLALPQVRRAARGVRAGEERVRVRRETRYSAARSRHAATPE